MKPKALNLSAVLLSLLLTTFFAAASDLEHAIDNILINESMERMLKRGTYNVEVDHMESNSEENTSFAYETVDYYFFARKTSRDNYALFSLNKANKLITKLHDGAKVNYSINRLNENEIYFEIAASESFPKGKYFRSDGTVSGTKPIELSRSVSSSFRNIWTGTSGELFANNGVKLYKQLSADEGLVSLFDVFQTQLILQGKGYSFFLGTRGTDSILYNELSDTTTVFDDEGLTLYRPSPRNLLSLDKSSAIYFIYQTDEVYELAKVSIESGYSSILNIDEIPNCHAGAAVPSLPGRIIEDANFVYFTAHVGSQICGFRYNKQTEEYVTLGQGDTEDFSYLNNPELFAVKNGKLIMKAGEIVGIYGDVDSLYALDFEQATVQRLLPLGPEDGGIWQSGTINIFAYDNDVLFAYMERICDPQRYCKDNMFFKLDFDTLAYTDFGNRIAASDKFQFVTGFNSGLILDDELYMFADLPQGGLYKTNAINRNIELFDPLYLGNDTEQANIALLHGYENGWFVIDANYSRLLHIGLDQKRTVLFESDEDFFWLSNGLRVSYSQDERYAFIYTRFIDSLILKVDLETFEAKLLYLEIDATNDYGAVVNIIDDTAYIKSAGAAQAFIAAFDLIQEKEVEKISTTASQIFQCSDKLFLSSMQVYPDLSRVFPASDLFVLDDGLKAVNFAFEGELEGLRLDSIGVGKMIVESGLERGVFDCETFEYNKLHQNNEGENYLRSLDTAYNHLNNSYYYKYDNAIWKLDAESQMLVNIFDIPPFYSIDINVLEFVFADNGVYFTAIDTSSELPLGSLYTFQNGALLSVRPLGEFLSGSNDGFVRDRLSHTLTFTQTPRNMGGKFLYGTFVSHVSYENSQRIITQTGTPFLFDTITKELHLLNIPATSRFFYSPTVNVNQGLLAFSAITPNLNQGLRILDIECWLENICDRVVANQPPVIGNGERLYYQVGKRVDLFARSLDVDSANLQYSLNNAPDWLKIDANGFLNGIVPEDAISEYSDVTISVSDGESVVTSTPYEFVITNASVSQPPPPPAEPPSVPPVADAPSSSGGGSMGLFLIFFLVLVASGRQAYRVR